MSALQHVLIGAGIWLLVAAVVATLLCTLITCLRHDRDQEGGDQ